MMLRWLLKPLAWLPLSWLHVLGSALGRLVYHASRSYSARLDRNLKQSGLFSSEHEFNRLRHRAAAEAGKTALELIAIWLGSARRLVRWVCEVRNYALVEEATKAGRGLLFLTPHLGCFEIAALYVGQRQPLTVLYRPPRVRWLEPLMVEGRQKGQTRLATTDLKGVRHLLKALRRGESIGVLPDQAPRFGEGVWAPFFGRPAFTMTLCNRLQRATGCATFMVVAERLPHSKGFCLHFDPISHPFEDEGQLNAAVEDAIRSCPEQYLWGYDRYKVPRDVAPPGLGEQAVERSAS